ncbi:kinase-like domain-containing protein [Xylaria cf. heliscus]|nr:kinase-like domain-containing protein [Xylaria cf. heliscus]
MAATARLPELARDSRLVTRMTPDYCVHFFAETPTVTRKEIWKRTKRIGAGGFGTVWLEKCIEGHEGGNDTLRAVKVLELPSSAQTQEAIAQCGRELEALAKFSQRKYSRCFVKSYGWYEHASSVSICLEYLPLGDLQAFITKRPDPRLPEPEVQQIVSQVLDGLVFMHAEGFAHRDLKPANILIKSYGPDNWWVKLSDFGLSKRTEVTRGATGLQGTPGFMAPELWGFLPNGRRSGIGMWCSADLWCLGEIAFQLVTGKATFPNPGTLAKYARGECEFPKSQLHKAMASPTMVDFVTATMLADYTQRPTAETASAHQWLQEFKTASPILPSHVRLDSEYVALHPVHGFSPLELTRK